MEKNPSIQTSLDQSKGQKIVGALYLVTQHLPDADPLKVAIRAGAVALVQEARSFRKKEIELLRTLLGGAVLARQIGERNVSILMHELALYGLGEDEDIGAMFLPVEHKEQGVVKKTEQRQNMSFTKHTPSFIYKNTLSNNENKSKRQSQILSFINERKSVAIKDISALFTDVSEKTIQRELGILVANGQITKRGSKRWSIYMAVV